MELDWMRSMITVIAFATFVGIVMWAWSARKRGDFDAAAHSILADDGADAHAQGSSKINNSQGRQS